MPIESEILELEGARVLCVTPLSVGAFHQKESFPVVTEKAMTADVQAVMVDLGKLELIDSVGMGAMTGLSMKLRKRAKIVLVNANPFVLRLFRGAGLHKVFDVLPSREEGLRYLKANLEETPGES